MIRGGARFSWQRSVGLAIGRRSTDGVRFDPPFSRARNAGRSRSSTKIRASHPWRSTRAQCEFNAAAWADGRGGNRLHYA
eukprot:4421941-Alexandrium_andersonii.AAC.1